MRQSIGVLPDNIHVSFWSISACDQQWIVLLTGGAWDGKMAEVLIQPLMYGKFMEYGHNGELSPPQHVCSRCLCRVC